jgi:hypothetical protein
MQKENFKYTHTKDIHQLIDEFPPDQKIICFSCHKRHFRDEDTFFTFYGNVTIGLFGGMIGNNLNEDGTIGRLSFICRKQECFEYLTKYLDIDDKEK